MYHVSAQGIDEHMINVNYYYYNSNYHESNTVRFPCDSTAQENAEHG